MVKATVEVTASHRGDYENHFFEQKLEVEAPTVGQALDQMVELSYELYFQTILYIMENFPEDYKLEDDYWYVIASYPSAMNPYSEDANHGAGSMIQDPGSIVEAVAHYRHMEISRFFKQETRYLSDGRFKQYVEGINPKKDFYDIFNTRDVPEYRDYGYTGEQLDMTIQSMGEEHIHFLEDYGKYISLISRGTPEKIVIPGKTDVDKNTGNSKIKRRGIRRLFRR